MSLRGPATAVMFLGCCTVLGGCANHRLEKEFFFKNSAATRMDRLRQYSLDDQYRLFRYGNDRIEPPLTGLAKPLQRKDRMLFHFSWRSSTRTQTI